MKTVFTTLAALSLLAGGPAHAADDGTGAIKVDVEKSGWECNDCVYVTVTAKTDNILIKKIDVNRGRCPQLKEGTITYQGHTAEGWWPNKGQFTPRKMQFAESLTWRFGNTLWQSGVTCNFVEARVYTDKGVFTFS